MRFLDSHPSYEQAIPKKHRRNSDLRQIAPAVESRINYDRSAAYT
jgi:hypothetical protein